MKTAMEFSLLGAGLVVMPLKEYENNKAGMNYWAMESAQLREARAQYQDALVTLMGDVQAARERLGEVYTTYPLKDKGLAEAVCGVISALDKAWAAAARLGRDKQDQRGGGGEAEA